MIRPPRLVPGARVAIVAPAGPVPRDRFAVGAAILGARYELVHDERIFARGGFLAGEDGARAEELRRALADDQLAAIFCARGGYGLMRILDGLESAPFVRAPKPIVGFSDVTALHAWASRLGVTSVHGPVVTQLGELPEEDRDALFALLESTAPPGPLTGLRTLHGGRAEGRLVGGNLELVTRLLGTPFAFELAGAVLLLEEIGEPPYKIDRQLTHLRLAGALDGLRGVVLGELFQCKAPAASEHPAAEAVVAERLAGLGIPVVAGAPVGHGGRNRALPHGVPVRLEADRGEVHFLEGAVG